MDKPTKTTETITTKTTKTIKDETITTEATKPKRDLLKLLGFLISIAALGLSLVNTLKPDLIPWNMNFEQRALFGDTKAQMYLANHCFQTNKYSESIRYYDMAVESALKKGDSKSLLIAQNNLGYFYATGTEVKQNWGIAFIYFHANLFSLKDFYNPIFSESTGKQLVSNIVFSVLNCPDKTNFDIVINNLFNPVEWYYGTNKLTKKSVYNAEDKYTFLHNIGIIEDKHDYFVYRIDNKLLKFMLRTNSTYYNTDLSSLVSADIKTLNEAVEQTLRYYNQGFNFHNSSIEEIDDFIANLYSGEESLEPKQLLNKWPKWYYANGDEYEDIKKGNIILLLKEYKYPNSDDYRIYGDFSEVAMERIKYIDRTYDASLFSPP